MLAGAVPGEDRPRHRPARRARTPPTTYALAARPARSPAPDERELAVRYAHAAARCADPCRAVLGNLLPGHPKLARAELISAEASAMLGGRSSADRRLRRPRRPRRASRCRGLPPARAGGRAGREMALDLIEPPVRFVKTIGDAVMSSAPSAMPLLRPRPRLAEPPAEGARLPAAAAACAAGRRGPRRRLAGRPANWRAG